MASKVAMVMNIDWVYSNILNEMSTKAKAMYKASSMRYSLNNVSFRPRSMATISVRLFCLGEKIENI